MDRGVPEELCVREATSMDKVVASQGALLQHHSSHVHRMSPFRALYGYDTPSFVDLVFGESRAPKAKDWLQESQDILRVLKENLQATQNQQKMYVDRHRVEHNFEVGDLVFLRLQPYRQSSLKKSGAEKLKPHFYGPYRVIRRVGEVAYELELPEGSRIHNTFHVSYLKKALGQQVTASTDIPPLDEEGYSWF
jgi:hypothetical protein